MLVADAARVRELADWSDGWCISVFLPVHPVEGKERGDALRLKNLLRDAELELVELGMRAPEAAELVSEAVPVELRDPASPVFHQAGIGLFLAPGIERTYRLTSGDPELVSVARRFHVKPLLRSLNDAKRFFLLAVNRGHAQLFAGDRNGLKPIVVPGMPVSLDDAIKYDDRERVLLSHSASRRGGGGVIAAFHGQGPRADHLPEDVMRYLRLVDAAVSKVLGERDPLVLAGSQDLVPQYREITAHAAVADETITGNPETEAVDVLHTAAWEIVHAGAGDAAEIAASRFSRLNGTGVASSDVAAVMTAARNGRVDTLFVASDAQRWGRFDGDAEEPELHDERMIGDEDLLATAAVEAWRAGATVHVVPRDDVPGDTDLAAVYRY